MDLSLNTYYDCTLCTRKGISQSRLLKHHMKWHRNIPYQMGQFTLAKTMQNHFQCKVCRSIIDGPDREEHQRKSHPMFKTHTGLYDGVNITRDLKLGVENWSNNKEVNCTRCNTKVHQKGFMEHIQRNHPDWLMPSFSTAPIAQPPFNTTPIAQPPFCSMPPFSTAPIPQPPFNSIPIAQLPFCAMPSFSTVPIPQPPFNTTPIAQPLFCSMPSFSTAPIPQPPFHSMPPFYRQPKKEEVANMPPIATKTPKEEHNIANAHMGTVQPVLEPQGINNMFAVQQSLATAKDSSSTNYYDCTMCKTMGIPEIDLVRHHKKFHRSILYQVDRYTLAKSIQHQYQCKICLDIVDGSQRDLHQEKNHPMFKSFSGLFETLYLTRDISSGLESWSNNKDATEFECVCCKNKVHHQSFVKHMQVYHPKRLKKSYIKSLAIDAQKKEDDAGMIPIEEVKRLNLVGTDEKDEPEKNEPAEDEDNGAKGIEPDDVRKFFDCLLCKKPEIPERHRLKHQEKFHPETPYRPGMYIFTKATQKMFQCKVCDVILAEQKQDEHKRTYHPMFKERQDLFESLLLVNDPKRGEQKWVGHKDAHRVKCHRCKHQFNKNLFLRHFQRKHKKFVHLMHVKESANFDGEGNSK
ncbi:uncharacterized protein LOC129579551 [Sitodiplosis mosellana]|uniref:uncharacterized protein LOC129579551 n=1 Tax=Sitodiplosis mosellana TaxID=263140 RepID=UPI002443C8A4|nr:uncharacterized protein LOC129579551 [Sitodiplosis mosellana]XP_055325676.1 uncharacterized protein LOC129579551 [Sitodiplosis mosellana]